MPDTHGRQLDFSFSDSCELIKNKLFAKSRCTMSDLDKCFARPKVRFSKSAESPDATSALGVLKQKPIARSVTSLRPQIKVLKAPIANNEFGWNSSPEEISSRRSGGDSLDDEHLRLSKTKFISSPDSEEFLPRPENPNGETECPRDTGSSRTSATSADHRSKTPKSILAEKKPSSAKSVHFSSRNCEKSIPQKTPESSADENNSGANLSRPKSLRSNKENIPSRESSKNVILKVPENTPRSATSKSTAKSTIPPKNRPSATEKPSGASIPGKPAQTVTKTSTEVKKKPRPPKRDEEKGRARKVGEPQKPAKTALMACMKSARPGISKAPIKKTIVRDASTTRSKIHIGPGMPRSKTPDRLPSSRGENNRCSRSEIHSANKLARPEFNSITCTLRQLREAQKEKIVPDVEHLPAFYRRLINGKVSSALDFGANEAIYRDLIDLSIDEKQLPTRMTRSKDPEPRQRDITPKLSDFFVPTNEDEFRRAVLVRPPSPRVLDTWNPYKISDRIFSWKESLDREF